jgi:hypothetical protein
MELDLARGRAKRAELVQLLSTRLIATSEEAAAALTDLAERIVDACCSITSPEAPDTIIHFITLGVGGGRGGRSRKFGNLALNIRKLVATAASGALAVAGMAANPWTAPLGALVLWDAIWSKMEVDIQECEARRHRDEENDRSRHHRSSRHARKAARNHTSRA